MGVVLRLRGGQAHRPVRSGRGRRPGTRRRTGRPSCVSSELDRDLDHLGPGVAEVRPGATALDRAEVREALAQLGVDRQVEVARREVDEVGRLLLDRGHDLGVGVTGRGHRDAGREVEEEVAVDVLDRQAFAADGDDRVGAGQARRGPRLVVGDVGPGLGARDLGDDVGNRPRLCEPRRGLDHGAPRSVGRTPANARLAPVDA